MRARLAPHGAALAAALVGVLLTPGCRGGCGDVGAPVLRTPAAPAEFLERVEGTFGALAGDPEHASLALVAGDDTGTLRYLLRAEGGLVEEDLVGGWTGGAFALTHAGREGEAVVAAIVEPEAGVEPTVGPLVDAPSARPSGEGDLVVARRRRPGLWRRQRVVARAQQPSVRLADDGSVHVAFLQQSLEGFSVGYLRLEADRALHEEIGRTPWGLGPVLTLEDGRPVVTWVDDRGALTESRADTRHVFSHRPLPEALLGVPEAPPVAFDRRGDRLVAVRPVEGAVTFGERRVRPKGPALLVIAVSLGESPRSEPLGLVPGLGGATVALGPAGAAVTANELPVRVGPAEPASGAGGTVAEPATAAAAKPDVPWAGPAHAAAVSGDRLVYAGETLVIVPAP